MFLPPDFGFKGPGFLSGQAKAQLRGNLESPKIERLRRKYRDPINNQVGESINLRLRRKCGEPINNQVGESTKKGRGRNLQNP